MTEQRYTLGYIQVGDPDLSVVEECADCGFDSVVTFPLFLISANGVSRFGTHRACTRCFEESHP